MVKKALIRKTAAPAPFEYDDPVYLTEPQTFTLQKDYHTHGSAFIIESSDVTVDLNGYTIYYDHDSSVVPNYDFELQGVAENKPANWNLALAPNAERISTAENPKVNNWCLKFPFQTSNQTIVSDWFTLPANTNAGMYLLRGGQTYWYRTQLLFELEHQTLGVVAAFQHHSQHQHWITTPDSTGPYRLRLTYVYVDRPAWQPNTVYYLGDEIVPNANPSTYWFRLRTINDESFGVSGSVEPTWPLNMGETVLDGELEWKMVSFGQRIREFTGSAWEPNSQYSLYNYVQVRATEYNYRSYLLYRVRGKTYTSGSTEPDWTEPPSNLSVTENGGNWRAHEFTDEIVDVVSASSQEVYGVGVEKFNIDNITIKNGTITQVGYGYRSPCVIATTGGRNYHIHNLYLTHRGVESSAIKLGYIENATIEYNTSSDLTQVKFNRHEIQGCLEATHMTDSVIQHNTVAASGWLAGVYQRGTRVTTENNTISTRQVFTNHYGIVLYSTPALGTSYVTNNIVDCNPGQGILISLCKNVIVNNNTITIKQVGVSHESGRMSLDGIRVNDYGNGICDHIEVHHNNVTIYGKQNTDFVAAEQALNGICASASGTGNYFHHNTIVAHSVDSDIRVQGIQPGSALKDPDDPSLRIPSPLVLWEDNHITSDEWCVCFGQYSSATLNSRFVRDTYVEGSNPTVNLSILGDWNKPPDPGVDNTEFVDCTTTGASDLRTIDILGTARRNQNYSVKHTITIDGPPNASVEAKNKWDEVLWSTTTDGDGFAQEELSEFISTDQNVITEYNPYTITVDGVPKSVTVDQPQTVTFP